MVRKFPQKRLMKTSLSPSPNVIPFAAMERTRRAKIVATLGPSSNTPEIFRQLVRAGLRVNEIGPERRSLEDLVLSVTGAGSDRFGRTPAPAAGGFTTETLITDGSAAARDAEAGRSSQ